MGLGREIPPGPRSSGYIYGISHIKQGRKGLTPTIGWIIRSRYNLLR
jgi:hypothetical protein